LDIFKSNFLGDSGVRTLFNIEIFNGRVICDFSDYASEEEVLLLPGTHVRVIGELKQSDGLHIIHLKQIEPSYFLFDPSEQDHLTSRSTPQNYQQQSKFVNDEELSERYSSDDGYPETQSKCILLVK
jgi:hypothetical protein